MTEGRSGSARVLIADYDETLRYTLRLIVEEHYSVVGEAPDGYAAVGMSEQLRPDVVLLDISMPRLGGLEAMRRFRERLPEVRIILDGKQDQVCFGGVRPQLPGVQKHHPLTQQWKGMTYFVVPEVPVLREYFLQERPQCCDFPLPVPEIVDEAPLCLLTANTEAVAERPAGRSYVQSAVEHEQRFTNRIDDTTGVCEGTHIVFQCAARRLFAWAVHSQILLQPAGRNVEASGRPEVASAQDSLDRFEAVGVPRLP